MRHVAAACLEQVSSNPSNRSSPHPRAQQAMAPWAEVEQRQARTERVRMQPLLQTQLLPPQLARRLPAAAAPAQGSVQKAGPSKQQGAGQKRQVT
jgi:hypothetical protein